ncbi:MAG: hypothetical protein KBS41_02870, partial [Oscillospiraceae bacterium]|nr:hypothetical protein [Candidatus Equicaccousia limihippi]
VILSLLILSMTVITAFADASLKIYEKTDVGKTEYIVSVSGCGDATSASVDVACPSGVTVKSGSWLKSGKISAFDLKTNKGAIGGLDSPDINGDVFKFTLIGESGAVLPQNLKVTVTAKNGGNEIFNQTATLSVKTVEPAGGKTVSAKSNTQSDSQSNVSQDKSDISNTASDNSGKIAPENDPPSDFSPYLYLIIGASVVAVLLILIVLYKKRNAHNGKGD